MNTAFNIGDLVEIIYIGEGTSYFPWTETSVPGIYLGTMVFTHYNGPDEKIDDVCHKVWSMGKVRYISNLEDIKMLVPKNKN